MFHKLQNFINKQVKETGKGSAKQTNVYRQIYYNAYPYENHKCKSCGKELLWSVNATVDHIVPQHLGGTNALTNLQILCQSCNSRKREKIGLMTLKMSKEALIREIRRCIKW